MAKINLKVDKNVYQQSIGQLGGYVSELQTKLGEYRSLRNRIDGIWSDDQADKYKEAIDEMTKKVQAAIDATNAQIKNLQEVIRQKEEEEIDVGHVVQDAVDVIYTLF